MHYRLLGAAFLLLNSVVSGAPHDGRHHGLVSENDYYNDTLVTDNIVATGAELHSIESNDSNHAKRHPKKKPKDEMKPPPEQQKLDDEYNEKFHEDDEYAEWAKDENLGRGPAWSKVLRLTLYKNPGKVIADRGVGLGKAWSANEDGFIRDRTEEVNKLPNLFKQRLGLIPRKNRRLPPRSGTSDPTITADPPPARTPTDYERVSYALKVAAKKMIDAALLEAENGNSTGNASPAMEVLNVNGTSLAVIPTSTIATKVSPGHSIVTVNGQPLALVTESKTSMPTKHPSIFKIDWKSLAAAQAARSASQASLGQSIVTIGGTPLAVMSVASTATQTTSSQSDRTSLAVTTGSETSMPTATVRSILTVAGFPLEVVSVTATPLNKKARSLAISTSTKKTVRALAVESVQMGSSSIAASSPPDVHVPRRNHARALEPPEPPAQEISAAFKPLLRLYRNEDVGVNILRVLTEMVDEGKLDMDDAMSEAPNTYDFESWEDFAKETGYEDYAIESGSQVAHEVEVPLEQAVHEVEVPLDTDVVNVAKPRGMIGKVLSIVRAWAYKVFAKLFPQGPKGPKGIEGPTAPKGLERPTAPKGPAEPMPPEASSADSLIKMWREPEPEKFGEFKPQGKLRVDEWLDGLKQSYTPEQWAELATPDAANSALQAGRPEALEDAMRASAERLGLGIDEYAETIATVLREGGEQQSDFLGELDLGQEAFEQFLSSGGTSDTWHVLQEGLEAEKLAAQRTAANSADQALREAGGAAAGEAAADAAGDLAAEAAADGAAFGAAEVAGELAFDGAFEAAALATESVVLGALNILPIVGQVLDAVLLFVTVLTTLLDLLMPKKQHHPRPPDGDLHFAFDWDGRPYQYDNAHPKLDQGDRPEPTPPPQGCDTFDMPELERRGWTTTQYAMNPCPTWVPQECTREWFEQWREQAVTGNGHPSRHNPNYCFESLPLKPKDQVAYDYNEALKHSAVAGFSQYAGHELADLEHCLGPDKTHGKKRFKQRIIENGDCHKKYLPRMVHHNLRLEHCKENECKMQADKWRWKTTGWPTKKEGCKNGKQWACWKRWLQKRVLRIEVGDSDVELDVESRDQVVYSNSSVEATPEPTRTTPIW